MVTPAGIGLIAVAVIVVILIMWPGGGAGAGVAIAAGELPADGEGRVSVTVTGYDADSRVEIGFRNAESYRTDRDTCVDERGFLSCALDDGLDEQTIAVFVVPQPRSTEVIATATVFTSGAEAGEDTLAIGVTGQKPTADRAPRASFTFSVSELELSVDASGSSDADGSVEVFDWDFGDGSSGSGETASHLYRQSGTYTVTLTVTDDDGLTDQVSRDVAVVAPTRSEPGVRTPMGDVTPLSTDPAPTQDVIR